MQIAPRNEKTKKMLYRKISNPDNEQIVGIGIRILSQARDPWLPPKLKKLARHESPMIRKSVIQSLHKHCPADRWDLMKNIAKDETNKSVIETLIREATLLSGDEAKSFFKMLSEKELHDRAKNLITQGETKVASGKGPCR